MTPQDRADLERILQQHPDVFQQAPELLECLDLKHGAGGGSISLIERQAAALRQKIATLEAKMADMLRFAEENEAIASRLLGWVRGLLLCASVEDRLALLPRSLADIFHVPSVGVGLWAGNAPGPWRLAPEHPLALQFGDLSAPLCLLGASQPAQAAMALLPPDASVDRGSLALLPLRQGLAPRASGLLVLASGDPGRFTARHGTEFLEKISELASAALLACPSPPQAAATPSQPS